MVSRSSLNVCLTGAAGQIAYSLLPSLVDGTVFGQMPINLFLLDIASMLASLEGVKMELDDCGYMLLNSVTITDDPKAAFDQCDIAVLVGAMPRKEGMQRRDLLKANAGIFKIQGEALDRYAKKSVKVLVVGNPANTNALIASHYAPSIPKEAFSALTRLDESRARNLIAKRLKVPLENVENVIIWGNHSNTQYPDISHAQIREYGLNVAETMEDHLRDFIKAVQNRGAAVIAARRLSSAMSAAKAIGDHLRDWIHGTDRIVSMAVCSDGSYGLPKGLFCSFPVTCTKTGQWKIVQGLDISEFSRGMIELTAVELVQERDEAFQFLNLQ